MSRKPLPALVVVVALIALGVAAWFEFLNPSSPAAASGDAGAQRVTVTAWDRTLGNPNAPVQLVEYASPQCPICSHFFTTYFAALKKKYIDTGKVQYVLRVYPLSPADVAAEAIARCLPAAGYFQFLDLLWRNQIKWDPEFRVPDVRAGLVEMGRMAGMNAQKVDSCIGNDRVAEKVTEVGNEASSRFGIDGVPTFLINGRMHKWGNDWAGLQKAMDDAAKETK